MPVRRLVAAAVDRYLLLAALTAANPAQRDVAVDRWNRQTDGQTDGRTLDRFVDPAAHCTRWLAASEVCTVVN